MRVLHVAQAVLILIAGLQPPAPAITAPVSGQVLQGSVTVVGTVDAQNFSSAELAFAYASDPTDTWFPIQVLAQPAADAPLGTWDTSGLTDGDYRLRLRVYLLDGSIQDSVVEELHVRNQAPPATGTPTAAQLPPTWTPSPSPEPDLATGIPVSPTNPAPTAAPGRPTPLPLPSNPAAITVQSVYSNFGRGALIALLLFGLLALLFRLRRP
ncbi:MAG: hypothetical protein ACM3QS_01990 [Bacteroidota bacterium]